MNPKSAIVVFAVFLILCGAIAIGSSESEANKTGSSTDSGTGSSSGTGNDPSATEDTEITSASGDCGTTTVEAIKLKMLSPKPSKTSSQRPEYL